MIESLQAGRALAALAVVVHHSAVAARNFAAPVLGQSWLELGYLGVDFFFVLSGFIIFHSTVGRSKTAEDYAIARFKRIYVPYLPIGIGIAILYILLPDVSAGQRQWNWLPTLTLAPVGSPALSVAWTLQHEVLFYLVFGLSYFSGRLFLGLAAWSGLIILNALFLRAAAIPLALINLEFMMGVAVALLKDRRPPPLWLVPIPAIAWLMLGSRPEWSILIGLSCALAMWHVVRLELAGKLTVPSWLVFLGAASYAIYLAHTVAISVVARLLPAQPYGVFLAGCIAGATAGVSYYLIVERPLLGLIRRFRKPAPAPQ